MSQFSTPPTVPPTTEFDELPAALPSWPKVVGIISICWGAFWLLCGGCGLVNSMVGTMFQPPPEMAAQMPPPELMKPGLGQMVMMVVGMAMALLVLIAGIMTVRRAAAGRILHLVYAGISLPLLAVSSFLHIQAMAPVKQWISENPGHQGIKQAEMMISIGNGMAIVLSLISLAYIVFLLIWFGAVKRNASDMGVVVDRDVI